MQVFLNLVKNSERAMNLQPRKELSIQVNALNQKVLVQILDTGSGVANPTELFKPFQQQAEATGLGLYLSRAFVRSFQGDLRYEPSGLGAKFVIELIAWKGEGLVDG